MFERFTQAARRGLYFARYEVVARGGQAIEPEHLVLGVLRETPSAVMRFARTGHSLPALQRALAGDTPPLAEAAAHVETPFSLEAKGVLERARDEADAQQNRWITPEHLIAGVMTATTGVAVRALRDAGVDVEAIREQLRHAPDERHDV